MSANVEQMAYTGEKPWHESGNELSEGAPIEVWRVEAGLDWGVRVVPIKYRITQDGRQVWHTSPGHRILIREDTGAELDVIGPDYVPTQNDEVLEFFREYVDAGNMTLETAGSLNDGRDVWALARMDDAFELAGGDKTAGYILLANPHRYGRAMVLKNTWVRVVCWNTYTAAIRGGGDAVKLWHRGFSERIQQEAKRRLGIARDQFDVFAGVARRLSEMTLEAEDVARVAASVFGTDPDRALEDQTPTVRRIVDLWDGAGMGADLAAADHTAWGAFNAFTQYHDHEKGRTPNRRLTRAWFGDGEIEKRKALGELKVLAGLTA